MSAIIFPCDGQSNDVGELLPLNQFALANCWVQGINGITRPLTEPAFANANQATGSVNHAAADPAPGQSQFSSLASRLRALGVPVSTALIFVPAALGGATAASWQIGTGTESYLNLYPAMVKQVANAMLAKGALLGPWILNQGEAEASTSAVVANAWGTTWTTAFNAWVTLVAAKGWPKWKNLLFLIEKLQVGSVYTWAPNVIAAQQALATSRPTDTIAIQEPDAIPAGALHLGQPEQDALGVLAANTIFAAA